MANLFGEFEYLTNMAEKAYTGVPKSVFWAMAENKMSFNEAMDDYASATAPDDELLDSALEEPEDLEPLYFEPPDLDYYMYDPAAEEGMMFGLGMPGTPTVADEIEEMLATENVMEKAAYQTGISDQQKLDLMQQGFTEQEAVMRNPGTSGMMTPWGTGLNEQEVEAIMNDTPGLYAYAGTDIESWPDLEEAATQIESQAGPSIDEIIDETQKAAISSGQMLSFPIALMGAGNFFGSILKGVPEAVKDAASYVKDIVSDSFEIQQEVGLAQAEGYTTGGALGVAGIQDIGTAISGIFSGGLANAGEHIPPEFTKMGQVWKEYSADQNVADGDDANTLLDSVQKDEEEIDPAKRAAQVTEAFKNIVDLTPNQVAAKIQSALAEEAGTGGLNSEDVEKWVKTTGGLPEDTKAIVTELVDVLATKTGPSDADLLEEEIEEYQGSEDYDEDQFRQFMEGQAFTPSPYDDPTKPIAVVEESEEPIKKVEDKEEEDKEDKEQDDDQDGDAPYGSNITDSEQIVGELDTDAPSYYDYFSRLFDAIPGSQRYEAQQQKTNMFKEAETLFYLLNNDWTSYESQLIDASTGAPPEGGYTEDQLKEQENIFTRFLYSQNEDTGEDTGYFADPKSLRFGRDFYAGVRDLRNRMSDLEGMSMENLYETLMAREGPQHVAGDPPFPTSKLTPEQATKTVMDRFTFMDPGEQSANRLATLVSMYNTHPGADNWLKGRMKNFYKNMMANWQASGRNSYDFIKAFVKDRPAMPATDNMEELT